MTDRRAFTIGGAVAAVVAAAYGVLVKGDELRGALEFGWSLLEPSIPFLRDWGWILVFGLGLGAVFFGDPRRWFARLFTRRASTMTLNEMIRYVTTESTWIKDHQAAADDEGAWVTQATSDIRDALSLGAVRAQGRGVINRGFEKQAKALEWLAADVWREAEFPILAAINDPTQPNRIQSAESEFDDIRVVRRDVRKLWRPLRPWDRGKFKPPVSQMTDEQRETREMIELLEKELATP